MPNWFTRWWKAEPDPAKQPAHGPLECNEQLDWIVVPYRFAEAARVSLYTIAFHPELQDNIRQWILDWLGQYNVVLANYFYQNYGPEVFDLLAQISAGVTQITERAAREQHANSHDDLFDRWEAQMKDNDERA